jgi:small subunit ribosomal protein S8
VTEDTGVATMEPAESAPKAERAPRKPAAPPKKARPKTVGMPNDPVADLLTRVRNAAGARHETVSVPTSRMKVEVARILRDEGFISGYEPGERELVLKMKFVGKLPAVTGLRRISKPGLRVYARKSEMPRVLGGLGVVIVSTSSGLMTGREAERKGLGGEVLAYVW